MEKQEIWYAKKNSETNVSVCNQNYIPTNITITLVIKIISSMILISFESQVRKCFILWTLLA